MLKLIGRNHLRIIIIEKEVKQDKINEGKDNML